MTEESFAELVNTLMEERGWDIGELAEKIGIHRNSVSKHLNGHKFPHRSTRKLYAQAFSIDPDEFERMYRQRGFEFERVADQVELRRQANAKKQQEAQDNKTRVEFYVKGATKAELEEIKGWIEKREREMGEK